MCIAEVASLTALFPHVLPVIPLCQKSLFEATEEDLLPNPRASPEHPFLLAELERLLARNQLLGNVIVHVPHGSG